MHMEYSHEDGPGAGGDDDVHHIDIQGVVSDDAEDGEAFPVPCLEAEGEDQHGDATGDGDQQIFDAALRLVGEVVLIFPEEGGFGYDEERDHQYQQPEMLEKALGGLFEKELGQGSSQQ